MLWGDTGEGCKCLQVCVCVLDVVEDRGWVGALGAAESLPGELFPIGEKALNYYCCSLKPLLPRLNL